MVYLLYSTYMQEISKYSIVSQLCLSYAASRRGLGVIDQYVALVV
jgi:hypothetical protein